LDDPFNNLDPVADIDKDEGSDTHVEIAPTKPFKYTKPKRAKEEDDLKCLRVELISRLFSNSDLSNLNLHHPPHR